MSDGAPWRVKPTTRVPFSRACRARLPPIRPSPITPYSFLPSVIDLLLIPCSFFTFLQPCRFLSESSQRHPPSNHLDRPQDRPGGGTVAPLDLDRQTDQFVLARCHLRKVQALDDPDPHLEQRLVRLDTVLAETTHREVIDADGLYPTVGQIPRRLLRDIDEILVEILRRPAASRVLRLEQDPLAALKPVRMKLVGLDRFGVADLYHSRPPDGRCKRHLVQAFAVLNEMDRTIHVGSGVSPHRDLRYIGGIAALYAQRPSYPDRRVVRPVDHTAPE